MYPLVIGYLCPAHTLVPKIFGGAIRDSSETSFGVPRLLFAHCWSGLSIRPFIKISSIHQFKDKLCKFVKVIGIVDFDSLQFAKGEWSSLAFYPFAHDNYLNIFSRRRWPEITDAPCEAVQ
jgi:hypothetical protein